jgi:hypothetical protein
MFDQVDGVVECLPDAIPFQDPLWKAILALIAVLAALAAYKVASEGQGSGALISGSIGSDGSVSTWCDVSKLPTLQTSATAGILSIIAGWSLKVALSDGADPWTRGRWEYPVAIGDVRLKERVVAKWRLPDRLQAGAEWTIPTDWTYTSTRASGALDEITVNEVTLSASFIKVMKVDIPKAVRLFERIIVDLELIMQDGLPLQGNCFYGFVLFHSPQGYIVKRYLENVNWENLKTLDQGKFQAVLSTEAFALKGKWKAQLFGQLINSAPEGLAPNEAAQYMGGDPLLAPVTLAYSNTEGGSVETCGEDQVYTIDVV